MPDTQTPPPRLTWTFDSLVTVVTDTDGTQLPGHRVLVNNQGAAMLYRRGSATPIRRVSEAAVRANPGGGFVVSGVDADGNPTQWTTAKAPKPGGR